MAHGGLARSLKSFWADESAQGLSEYALIIGIVAIGLLIALVALHEQLGRIYVAIKEEVAEQLKRRPGLGQGEGCASVHGCRDLRLKAQP
jgi:Flp pilus assembly pilin Flp